MASTPLPVALCVVAAMVLLELLRRIAVVQRDVRRLAISEAHFRAIVHNSTDAILIVDPDGALRYATPSADALFGEAHHGSLFALTHPEDGALAERFLQHVRRSEGVPVVEEWRMRRPDGSWLWIENTGTNLLLEPTVGGIVVNSRDVSERHSLEAQLTHQASHDELTRLANRTLFLDRVAQAVSRRGRDRHPPAVLFLDLDDFKKVNDSLGHAVGDELLVAAAARLASCVRPGDMIARLGGDEFAVLLEGVDDHQTVTTVAGRIAEGLRSPFRISGRDVFVSVSIGIADVSHGDTPDDIVRNADLAMYFAKSRAKGRFVVYEREMHAQVMERLELEADLRRAVDRASFFVEYQPIVHLTTGLMYGAEALLRWRHPERGLVSPTEFVALAEDTGLIVPIGRVVLREACERATEWRARQRRDRVLRLSVNLSPRHFQESSVVEDVREALVRSGLPAQMLTLEITESVLMQEGAVTLDKLRALKSLGLQLALDDFGTGYSSLGYLQRFPIDILKIDRTFVEAVGSAGVDPAIARAIVALGRSLRIETIAEGIERAEQREGLLSLGCTLGQGFLFARSMSAEEFVACMVDTPRSLSIVQMYAPAPRAVRIVS
jgi:diguanylate cyclase (GGDEF)-like protein/PAS domain S-box-containing protein